MTSPYSSYFKSRRDWAEGITASRRVLDQQHDVIRTNSEAFTKEYQNRIPAMVVDVVLSRRRRYQSVVVPRVKTFEARPGAQSLDALSKFGSGFTSGLLTGEDTTIRNIASGLLRVAGSDDAERVQTWATLTDGLEICHDVDEHVGSVTGVGMALFAYLRMRAGGDSIKIDVRVRRGLSNLGFVVPKTDVGVFLLADAISQDLCITKLELDQMLWHLPQ